jgi:hypothetical protein
MNLQITKCGVLAQSVYRDLMDLQSAIEQAQVQASEIVIDQQRLDAESLAEKTRQLLNRIVTIHESALAFKVLAIHVHANLLKPDQGK